MHKLNSILFVFLSIFSFYSTAQTTLTLQPGPNAGKDAIVHELPSQRNSNFGSNIQLSAHAGTTSGTPFIARGFVQFDLSSIPQGKQIDSAFLSLYAYDRANGFAMHRNSSGPNNAWMRRVTSSWTESNITWNNSPTTTTMNQVALSPSVSQNQNYLDINISSVTEDIYLNTANYGMQIILQNENHYRTLNFYSSDAVDSLKRPKLVVHYSSIATSVSDANSNNRHFIVFPNPTKGIFQIEFDNEPNLNLNIIDLTGKKVASFSNYKNLDQINLSNLAEGVYFIRASNRSYNTTKKLIIKN